MKFRVLGVAHGLRGLDVASSLQNTALSSNPDGSAAVVLFQPGVSRAVKVSPADSLVCQSLSPHSRFKPDTV